MGHIALYRQFRPVTFDEVVEQKHAVASLRQSVISGQIAHAYLFCGTRGTGKTSIAKIFSRAINCLQPDNGSPCNQCEICLGILNNTLMDVIEMDAASNNSVDNIRRICDEVMFLPSRAKYKVYIIDEVHMLSGGAFNALLKTLEEPPAHAVFILATTEPHRIPATIISRCQRYDFRRIPLESIVAQLQMIANTQGTDIDHDALVTIANLSDGAMRDAISLLDQVSTGSLQRITRDDVLRVTGVVDDFFLYAMAQALLSQQTAQIIELTEQLVMDGRDIIRFTLDLAHYFRNLMVFQVSPHPGKLIQETKDSLDRMGELSSRTPLDSLVYAVTKLSALISELKWSPDMRTTFEINLLSFFPQETTAGLGSLPIVPTAPVAKSAAPVKTDYLDIPEEPTIKSVAPAKMDIIDKPKGPVVEPVSPVKMDYVDIPKEPVVKEVMAKVTAPLPPAEEASLAAEMSDYMPPPAMDLEAFMAPAMNLEAVTPPAMDLEVPTPPAMDLEVPTPPAMDLEAVSPSAVPEEFAPTITNNFPMDVPADTKAEEPRSKPAPRILPLAELWATLLHNWEDSIFSDVLQLKRANVHEHDQVFHIVFPLESAAYANSLTQREDYKRIMKDIQMMISGISTVVVEVENSSSGQSTSDLSAPAGTVGAQPEWVAQMMAFAEATGIPVETLDRL